MPILARKQLIFYQENYIPTVQLPTTNHHQTALTTRGTITTESHSDTLPNQAIESRRRAAVKSPVHPTSARGVPNIYEAVVDPPSARSARIRRRAGAPPIAASRYGPRGNWSAIPAAPPGHSKFRGARPVSKYDGASADKIGRVKSHFPPGAAKFDQTNPRRRLIIIGMRARRAPGSVTGLFARAPPLFGGKSARFY